MRTCTHLAPRTLNQWRKHHKLQTLSAVSCQRSAVSCRSFCTRVHAFGTSPASLPPHYLPAFSTTDTTTTTTTTTHPINQTPAMYHNSQHYASDTHYLSVSPINIYQAHAPFQTLHSHHYLHASNARPHKTLLTRFSTSMNTPHAHLSRAAQNVFANQKHRHGWKLVPNVDQEHSINGTHITTCKPCQLSAVVTFVQGSSPLERLQPPHHPTIYLLLVLLILLPPLLLPRSP